MAASLQSGMPGYAATRTLAQRKQDINCASKALQSDQQSYDELFSVFIGRLPILLKIKCHYLDQLTSIQGIPPTLRSVDLSGCNSLTSLAPLQHCTALERLTLELGIHSAQQWESLVDTLPPLMSAVSSHLQHLTMAVICVPISHSADEKAVRALQPLTRLKDLAFRMLHCNTRPAHWQLLADTVVRMTGLQGLDLSGNGLAAAALAPLASAIRQLKWLKSLNLFDDHIYHESASSVVRAIASLPATLTSINIGSAAAVYDRADAQPLADAVQAQSATLRCLQLRNVSLGPDGITELAPALSCCSGLTDLDISGCNIIPDDLQDQDTYDDLMFALDAAVSDVAETLTSLNISDNNLGFEGTATVAPALDSMAPNLMSFDISNNFLGCRGAATITHALVRMTALTYLDFSSNGQCLRLHDSDWISDDEGEEDGNEETPGLGLASSLASSMGNMCKLATLHIQSNGLGAAGAQLLAPALSIIAPSLTCLNISENRLGDDGVAALASALGLMTALQHLDSYDNSLGPAGAAAMASALPAMVGLQRLDLGDNCLGLEGLRSLAQGLRALPRQQHWDITGHQSAAQDTETREAVASIASLVSNLRAWKLRFAYCMLEEAEAVKVKVLGLEVGLSELWC